MTVTLLDPPESRKYTDWRIDELYFGGPAGSGTLYRPRVGDKVTDWDNGEYRVVSVNSDGIPTLEKKLDYLQAGSFDPTSISLITALTQPQPNVSTPLFFDENTLPYYTCVIDITFPILGVDSEKMIFFRGTDISENGEIISMVFNSSGGLVSNEVPLVAADPTRPAIKRPVPFSTTYKLTAGEIVTGVAYNNLGGVGSKTVFVVEESAVIRPADLAGVFLEDIRVVSPLLDDNDDTLIVNSLGTTFATTLLEAELKYSNGATRRVNIDGVKCKLLGWDRFDTSSLVAPKEVILVYYPDPTEPAINLHGGQPQTHLAKTYRITNIMTSSTYALKLFAVPVWKGVSNGWELRWRLMNLEREIDLDVTDEVVMRDNAGGGFVPTDYGTKQELNLTLDMDSVIPNTYNGHFHTQKFDITVNVPGGTADPFLIDYAGDEINIYGEGLIASVNRAEALISCEKNTANEWLSYLYKGISALYDTDLMNQPPTPTHFRIEYNGIKSPEFAVSDYDQRILVPGGTGTYDADKTLTIEWLIQDGANWDILGVSPLVTKLNLV